MSPNPLHPNSFGPRVPAPFDTVHSAFEHHARRQPDAVAVEHLARSITYADLDASANRLAHRLRRHGVLPGTRVCLLVQRSISMVIAIVAILKAGGAYVPLDGGIITDSSLEHVLADASPVLTLVQRDFAHRLSGHPSLCLEDVVTQDDAHQFDPSKPVDLSSPRDGVYVIYTSGTTGKPKGVDVMHRNVVNLLCLAPGNVGMRPGLRVAQLLNIAFDMCAWEVLGALANGCTLCLRGKTAEAWKATLKKVDVVIATPSVLGLYDPVDYPNIKFAATAGEVCPQALADKWSRTCQFFNSCGPTEITIVNTVQPHTTGARLSIGKPTPNNHVYILDDLLQPVAQGEQGIMWAGGAGVTRGYLNLPDKTSERYRQDPFMVDGSIMFNTGDIGRWRADGEIDHLGRADDQVKVKGFRVELDGVAAAMETCPGISVAAALLVGKELWGFYTPATVPEASVKAATAKIQPYYAVPSKYVPMTEFPHTSNGKTDRRALRIRAEAQSSATTYPIVVKEHEDRQEGQAAQHGRASRPTVHSNPAPVSGSADGRSSRLAAQRAPHHAILRGIKATDASALRLDMVTAAGDHPIRLQDCSCEPGLAGEQIHLVPVPIRVPRREQHTTRVEVVAIGPLTESNLSSHYSAHSGFSWSKRHWEASSPASNPLTRKATCALLVVGREVQSSAPGGVISKCGRCNGWGHAISGRVTTDKDHDMIKEEVADVACALTEQSGVEVVCILSDPKTSHALVNELGHRGVPVAVGVMA